MRAYPPPTQIVVRNLSASELRNVVISGSGFRLFCPTVPIGRSVILTARLTADTGIAVAFDAAGRHVAAPEQDYASGGGFRIGVEVKH